MPNVYLADLPEVTEAKVAFMKVFDAYKAGKIPLPVAPVHEVKPVCNIFFFSVLLILKANKTLNSSANIKPLNSKYTYYIHHSAYLQPSSVPNCTTYTLQPNEVRASHKGRVTWDLTSAAIQSAYPTFPRRPYFKYTVIQINTYVIMTIKAFRLNLKVS